MTETNSSNSIADFGTHEMLPITETQTCLDVSVADRDPSKWRDLVGITASIACAIHCAAMPFVIGFLPALGLTFLADESFHKWMAGACFVFALAAFVPGWKRHRRCMPAAVAASGLAIVTTAAFALSGECCPACELESQNPASVAAASDTPTTVEADCCDEHCEHCEEEAAANGDEVAEEGSTPVAAGINGFVTNNAAWWTPLGGALLVFAHMLNRCFVSRCICCKPQS